MRANNSERSERGAAALEFAIVLPILILLLAVMFDVGVGFGAGQSSAEAVRSAARVAAQDPGNRDSDYRALLSIEKAFADSDDTVTWVAIYRTTPAAGSAIPGACQPGGGGAADVCNVYSGVQLANLAPGQFDGIDCAGSLDALWCPSDRKQDEGDFLGVAIWAEHERTIGLIDGDPVQLEYQAAFPIFVGGP